MEDHARFTSCRLVLAAGFQCTASACRDEPCWILKAVQLFDRLGRENVYRLLMLPKSPNQYTCTLKMSTAVFAETLNNIQYAMRLNAAEVVPHHIWSWRHWKDWMLLAHTEKRFTDSGTSPFQGCDCCLYFKILSVANFTSSLLFVPPVDTSS